MADFGSVGLAVKPVDFMTPLERATSILNTQAQTAQTQQLMGRREKMYKAQDLFSDMSQAGDKDALLHSGLLAHTEAYATTQHALSNADENQRQQMTYKLDRLGRAANAVLTITDPRKQQKEWDDQIDQLVKDKVIDQATAKTYKGKMDNTTLYKLRAAGMAAGDYMTKSGQTEGLGAEAAAPAKIRVEQSVPRPYEPGKTGFHVPSGDINPPPSSILKQPPGEATRGVGQTGEAAPIPPPSPRRPGGAPAPAATTPAPATQTGFESHPLWNQIPVLPSADVKNPGDTLSARTPEMQQRIADASERYQKVIRPAAEAARTDRADLGSMRAELEGGDMQSSVIAPILTDASKWVYGITGGNRKLAKDLTGVDAPTAEQFTKTSVSRTLQSALQWEGARHAVQGTLIAMEANPRLANTREANLKIIDVMDTTAKWFQERDVAAQAYAAKNGGRLDGFETWYDHVHPLSAEVSKIVPWQIPTWRQRGPKGEEMIWDTAKMENGVTYNVPVPGPDGKPAKDKNGQDIMQPMTWNVKTGKLIPVH